MTDRPILFSGSMVRALLAGTKTQTRRLLSMPSRRGHSEFGASDTTGYDWHFRDKEMRWHDVRHARLLELLPHHVGDRLYVREAFRPHGLDTPMSECSDHADIMYRANADEAEDAVLDWKPSIHMPRWVSRLTLIVTDVRVQRLQDCSEADAMAEGVVQFGEHDFRVIGVKHPSPDFPYLSRPTAREMYAALWDVINGSGAWLSNPWVTTTTFEVIKQNIDQVPR